MLVLCIRFAFIAICKKRIDFKNERKKILSVVFIGLGEIFSLLPTYPFKGSKFHVVLFQNIFAGGTGNYDGLFRYGFEFHDCSAPDYVCLMKKFLSHWRRGIREYRRARGRPCVRSGRLHRRHA